MDIKLQRREMALGRVLGKNKKALLLSIVATVFIVATIVVLWIRGAFLPGWIEWHELTMDTSFLKKGVKVQDTLTVDVNHDGKDELLVLCWRIGRYGDRKPFWVKHDELKWSQHIYIYEQTNEDKYKAIWMASDIHTDVKRWEAYDNSLIVTYTPDNEKNVWIWNSWGLERMSEDAFREYDEIKKKKEEKAGKEKDIEETEYETNTLNIYDQDENDNEEDSVRDEAEIEESPDNISIVMVGDVLLHDGVSASCKTEDGYDFTPLFENTKEVIENADIAIVNQEVIIGGEELNVSGYPAFNAPYEVADALGDTGFDVVCHGTNHALDRNKKGIINCLNYWRENYKDVSVLGIHDSEEESNEICIITVKGRKIAVLNYTYATNGIPLPDGMPYAVELLKKDSIAEDLKYAEENADFTIVCPHWGVEYQLSENSEQQSMAEFMTENGADLIIGTHPHVVEPVKWIESSNGNRALCYYSLGNFINWTSGRGKNVANRMVGAMAYIELESDENGVQSAKSEHIESDSDMIKDFGVYPLVSHVEHSKGKVTTYFLQNYTDELASKNAITEQDSSFDLNYCMDLTNEVFGDDVKDIEKQP